MIRMHHEVHSWYSPRLGREMSVVVFGHYGPPMIAFPTTGGDEWEYERTGVVDAIAGFIDAGRVKVFCVNTNHSDSFGNCLLYTSPSPRDGLLSRMPSSA